MKSDTPLVPVDYRIRSETNFSCSVLTNSQMHRQVESIEVQASVAAKKESKYGLKVASLFKSPREQTLPHILSNRSDQSAFGSGSAPKVGKLSQIIVTSSMPKIITGGSPRNQIQHIPRLVVGPAVPQFEAESHSEIEGRDNSLDRLNTQIAKLKQTIQIQKEHLSDKNYQIQLMSQEIKMMRTSNEKLAQVNAEAANQAKLREKEHIEQNKRNSPSQTIYEIVRYIRVFKRLNATIAKLMREKEQAMQYLIHYQLQNGTLDDPSRLAGKSGLLFDQKLDLEFLSASNPKNLEESSSNPRLVANQHNKSNVSHEKSAAGGSRIKVSQELQKKASEMADKLESEAVAHRKVKPYDSAILNSRSEEQLNNSSRMSREVGSTEELQKASKKNSPQPSKRLLAVDELSPQEHTELKTERSPKMHKTSQILKPKVFERTAKQANDPITTAICLQLGRDSVNLILSATGTRYTPQELVETFRDLIKHFQKAFRAGFGEIVFFNQDFMNLVLETAPTTSRKLREVLEDKTPVLLIRPTSNREKFPSGGIESECNSLHTLCNELTYLKVEHKPHIKNGCFFLPLVTSFGSEESRVIGVMTMAKFGRAGGFEYGGTSPAEDKDVLARLQKAPILKDLYTLVSQFFTVLTTDLKRHRAQMDAERAAKICGLFKFSHEIDSALFVLRTEMPDILGYEEICFLIKPLSDNTDSLVSVSPNSSKDSLRNSRRCETFYFSPHSGFTMDCFRKGKMQHVIAPRDYENYVDGVDCLAPTIHLKEIVYVPLIPLGEKSPLGVMQLVNKAVGNVSQTDISLITTLAPAIGNWISLIIKGTKLSDTVDKVVDRVRRAAKDYENTSSY